MRPSRFVLALALTCVSQAAFAGGMFLPGRGARPMGRAGSFVAGADDGGALYYNPAGLADIDGIGVLLDAGLVLQRVHYDRVDSGGNPQPGVDGSIDLLPIPTFTLSWKPKKLPRLTVAGGVWVPYLGLDDYPEKGPQRYSNITINGSLVVVMELAAAYRITDHVWIGAGLQNMILKFKSKVDLSACTELNCAPEDPEFDSLTQLDATSGFTPSGNVGLTVAYPKWRVGATVQLPFFVRADGNVYSRLPTDPFFANASVQGSSVSVDFDIPVMVRIGFEYRPLPRLRAEIGADYEAWSMQQRLAIQPHGIYIDGVPGIGKYYLNTMYLNRLLDDTFSVHLGGEYEAIRNRLVVRAGYLFETSATPDEGMSVLTPDGMHNMLTLGLGVRVGPVRLDLGYAHVFTPDRTVTNSKSYQLNPIQPSIMVPVGNGTYKIDTDMISAGLDGRF